MPHWDDPEVHWPPLSVRPTQAKGKNLIKELEEEELTYLQMARSFTFPDFRPGDVIKFHYLHSLSEGNGNTITALCIGLDKPNTLMGSFICVFNFAGVPVKMKVKMNSPFLSDFQLVSKGSGNLRYKLNYIWKKERDTIPIAPIVKRSMAKRADEKESHHERKISKKLVLDKIEDPLIIE